MVRRFYQTTSCDNASRNEQTSEPPASLPNKYRIIVSLPHPLSKKNGNPPPQKTHTLPKTNGSPLKIGKLAPQKDRILFQPFMFQVQIEFAKPAVYSSSHEDHFSLHNGYFSTSMIVGERVVSGRNNLLASEKILVKNLVRVSSPIFELKLQHTVI